MECSEAMVLHNTCGIVAEDYFMEAMKNLGFEEINNGDKMSPLTIRRTSHGEERQKKDFIIRLPVHRKQLEKSMPIVPIQLTLMWFPENWHLKQKLDAAELGDIALIWANENFGEGVERHRNLFYLLKGAAENKIDDLQRFVDIFKAGVCIFYSKVDNVTESQVELAFAEFV